MSIIILVGVPGSGKTSILKEVARKIPSITIVNYGDKMLEEAAAAGLTRDRLRKMPISAQQEMGIKAAKRIQDDTQGITIVDTHALIKTEIGFCPGLPKEVLKILSPAALVGIECPASLILQRRKNDPSRARDTETVEDLKMHQDLIRSYLAACSMETGAVLGYVLNQDSSIETNCEPLIRLIGHFQ